MSAPSRMPAFQVSFPGHANAVDVFDTWQVQETTRQPGFLDAGMDVGSVWRADLPADPLQSAYLLDTMLQVDTHIQQALPAVQHRLQTDLELLVSQESAPSFSLNTGFPSDETQDPRSILVSAAGYRSSEVSFGLLDGQKLDPLQLDTAVKAVNGFAAQVHRTLEQFTLVETNIANKHVAVSRIGWDGDTHTFWQAGEDYEHFSLHNQVVTQVFATRQNWLNFLLLIGSGALRVSVALATTPFSPLTIWTTWNYLQQIIRQIRKTG